MSHRARVKELRARAEKERRARNDQLFDHLTTLVCEARPRGIGTQWRAAGGAVHTMLTTTKQKYVRHVATIAAAREFIEDGDKRIAALEQQVAQLAAAQQRALGDRLSHKGPRGPLPQGSPKGDPQGGPLGEGAGSPKGKRSRGGRPPSGDPPQETPRGDPRDPRDPKGRPP